MNIITLDFETYFDDDYTLKKMTTEEYVRDPRFEVHGLGVRYLNGDLHFFEDPWEFLHPWQDAEIPYAFLAHHAQFDGFILSHHYGIKPALWLDTLSMARQVVGNHLSVALESLAKHFHLPAKNVPYQLFKGKHWHELDVATQKQVADGCLHDIDLTWQIFKILMREFPAEELRVIDMTIRMFTEPVLRGNVELLGKVWMDEERRKGLLLEQLGISAADLQSGDKFASLLRDEGIEPGVKASPTGNGEIYAFAKTDEFMKELQEDDGRAGALARARLGVRSTIDQTRAERLGFMATRGALPVYLRYCGAHTTRWSGGDSINWQNFRRGSDIRRAIEAVQGSALIVLDLAQIECRVLNVLAGEWDVVEAFKEGRDIYAAVASEFYGRTIHKDAHPRERQFGKVLELGCLGPDTLVLTNTGTKPITSVLSTDWLWDGREWVKHQGVVTRGEKIVMCLGDLNLTPDHLVLCGNTWREARSLLSESMLHQALATGSANLPSPDIKSVVEVGSRRSWSDAPAERPSTPSTPTIFVMESLRVATAALKSKAATGLNTIGGMPTSVLMTGIANVFLTGYPLASRAADPMGIEITGSAGFMFISLGKGTNALSCPTSCLLRVGITRIWKLIVSTSTKGMHPVIYALQRIVKIPKTSDGFPKKSQTYDIACAGPRNRFTVVSSAGPLIVHNCGYGLGHIKLQAICRAGPMGGQRVDLSEDEARAGITAYRSTHPAVVDYWATAGRMIARIAGGPEVQWGPMIIRDRRVILPNGGWISYETLEYHRKEHEDDPWDDGWRTKSRQGWSKLYGGKLVENVVQALARVVLSQAMLRMKDMGYRVVHCTHDEVIIVVDKSVEEAQADYQILKAEMEKSPAWLADLPLKVEGGVSTRYEK